MVSPHPDWEDVQDGYRAGESAIFVEPAIVRDGSIALAGRCGVSPATASAFTVDVWTPADAWERIIAFQEARAAWEFANLLTHYFDGRRDVRTSKRALRTDDEALGGPRDVPAIVSETSPSSILETLLSPTPVPERVRAVVGAQRSDRQPRGRRTVEADPRRVPNARGQ